LQVQIRCVQGCFLLWPGNLIDCPKSTCKTEIASFDCFDQDSSHAVLSVLHIFNLKLAGLVYTKVAITSRAREADPAQKGES